jgi:hypothetical protein
MTVTADNSVVWEGSIGSDALRFDGPVGVRSDDARFEIELRAGETVKARAGAGCR